MTLFEAIDTQPKSAREFLLAAVQFRSFDGLARRRYIRHMRKNHGHTTKQVLDDMAYMLKALELFEQEQGIELKKA